MPMIPIVIIVCVCVCVRTRSVCITQSHCIQIYRVVQCFAVCNCDAFQKRHTHTIVIVQYQLSTIRTTISALCFFFHWRIYRINIRTLSTIFLHFQIDAKQQPASIIMKNEQRLQLLTEKNANQSSPTQSIIHAAANKQTMNASNDNV